MNLHIDPSRRTDKSNGEVCPHDARDQPARMISHLHDRHPPQTNKIIICLILLIILLFTPAKIFKSRPNRKWNDLHIVKIPIIFVSLQLAYMGEGCIL